MDKINELMNETKCHTVVCSSDLHNSLDKDKCSNKCWQAEALVKHQTATSLFTDSWLHIDA